MPELVRRADIGWSLEQVAKPATEPLLLNEAKLHLRVDHPDEDTLIIQLITAARQQAELFQLRSYITQSWRLNLDAFPSGNTIRLPRPPLQSVTSVVYTDVDNIEQTLDPASYTVDTASEPGRIVINQGQDWPETAEVPGAVAIDYVAGYGDTSDTVPPQIIAAIKLFVGHLYENREAITIGTGPTFTLAFGPEYLLWPHRVFEFNPSGGI